MAVERSAKKIKLLICDVDGVLTDGRIIYDGEGREIKNFDVQDGLGLVLLKKCGLLTAIIRRFSVSVCRLSPSFSIRLSRRLMRV